MVDTWQTNGRMVEMVNHAYATGLPLTHGQTVQMKHQPVSAIGLVVDQWQTRGKKEAMFCKG